MITNVAFTVLRYEPIIGNGELINIAMITHDYLNGEIVFSKIESKYGKKRLKSFDDTINSEAFHDNLSYIESYIKEPFMVDIFKQNKNRVVYDKNYLFSISTMFLNEIKMSKVNYYDSVDINEFVLTMKSLYFYFDTSPDDRPRKSEVIKAVKNYVENYVIDPLEKNNSNIAKESQFGKSSIDYSTNYAYIKLFNTDVVKVKVKLDQAKSLVFDSDNVFMDKKIIVIYFEGDDEQEDRYIKNILYKAPNIEVIQSNEIMTKLSQFKSN